MKKLNNVFVAALSLLITACGSGGNHSSATDSTAAATTTTTAGTDSGIVKTAAEAYVFGLPLVLMDITRRQSVSANSTAAFRGPVNQFVNLSKFPDATFKDVVRANADTYYSTAWLDLEKEPVILTVPDTKGRYYMMPMLDAYTNVFVSPGKRTTGTRAGSFVITGPKWSGNVPPGMQQIKAPTNTVWIIGRTQVNSKADGDKVVIPLQKQYKLTPLSAWGKSYTAPGMTNDPNIPKGSPNDIVQQMPVDEYFNYINRLMATNAPAAADEPVMTKFAALGIGPGKKFDLSSFSAADQQSIKNVPQQVLAGLKKKINESGELVNGWKPVAANIGTYGINYGERAFVSYIGLGANLPEDAAYPSSTFDGDGNKLNGANKYLLHFDKGQTPPANAFWSLTMYDADGFMVANALNRNAIGDRSNLKKNADGTVDIYIQHETPGKEKEGNWLPAPQGDFNILLRVYWPKQEMLNGSWKTPPIKKVG